jgi:hypothetical protein
MRRGRRTGEERMHAGMDLGHPDGTGTPIYNIQQGVVAVVLRDEDQRRAYNGYGNGVVVHHPEDDTWALYAHMEQVEPDIQPGVAVPAGKRMGTMGNTSNGKFPGMGPHLHLELRRRRPNGAPPFPGPYPRSLRQPFNNLDPRAWLEAKGLRFLGRGGFELLPGSPMAQGRALRAVSGVDPYPEQRIPPWGDKRRFPETALALGSNGEPENDYEPPARFDRDVYFGLKPIEWAAIGTGTVVAAGTAVAVFIRSRGVTVRPNRRRRRRARRRRTSRRR